MKSFFKTFLASCLGTLIALVAIGGIATFVVFQVTASKEESIKKNSVLRLTLNGSMTDVKNNLPISPFDFKGVGSDNSLESMLSAIEQAKEDDDIQGIYLDMKAPNYGWARSSAIREGLKNFKESGKFVIAYGDYFTQSSYYLAAVADSIFMNPMGEMDFRGFSSQIMFFKNAMDKLGVDAQIFYAGKFKSATEPFRRTDMSTPNRVQVRRFLGEMYTIYLKDLAADRNLTVDTLRAIANQALLRLPQDVIKYGLVDALYYKDQVLSDLRTRLDIEEDKKIRWVSLSKYLKVNPKVKDYDIEDKIAIVYAEGGIVDGKGERGSIGGTKYANVIAKLRKDKKVKAIVLRVNSGGGSAFASEQIWRELILAKEAGKPIVTSFGNVAASGGYYIATASDKILARPNTITGSIGVFAMIPNARELMEEKVGITMDTVRIGKFSAMNGLYYGFSDEEKEIFQSSVEEMYRIFKQRVADGRSMSLAQVDSLAQGRVWLGTDAKRLGLIDAYGDIDEAVAEAAELAGISSFRTASYPKFDNNWEDMLKQLTGENVFYQQLGLDETQIKWLEAAKQLKAYTGVQFRLPFEITVD